MVSRRSPQKGSHTWTTAPARRGISPPATPARPTRAANRRLRTGVLESATPVRLPFPRFLPPAPPAPSPARTPNQTPAQTPTDPAPGPVSAGVAVAVREARVARSRSRQMAPTRSPSRLGASSAQVKVLAGVGVAGEEGGDARPSLHQRCWSSVGVVSATVSRSVATSCVSRCARASPRSGSSRDAA